jgi:hypothetical protein
MEFNKLYVSLINELDQSTINRAVLKHQTIKDKNPIAKSRAEDFAKRARKQGQKRGILIRTKYKPDSIRTRDYADFYIESASIDDGTIFIEALMVDPFEDKASVPALLKYDTNTNTLFFIEGESGSNWTKQLWLQSRTDAQNLSKIIKMYTNINVSWKSMDFIASADYSNQYSDTRYDINKLNK